MIFTKAMIDLAKEIRRRAPSEVKPSLKMANPNLFIELAVLFDCTQDAIMKALIKEIWELSGETLNPILAHSNTFENKPSSTNRSQTHIVLGTPSQNKTNPQITPKKIYRGQVVQ